jgi:hypothetical protein
MARRYVVPHNRGAHVFVPSAARLTVGLTALSLLVAGCGRSSLEAMKAQDLTGAMAALESNLAAIHERDAEAYLAHYLDSPEFVVATSQGVQQGFRWFAEARRASEQWPDTFLAEQPTFRWIAPGVVWGAFSYRAVEGRDTTDGVSERLFVKTGNGWKIAVTGSMEQ